MKSTANAPENRGKGVLNNELGGQYSNTTPTTSTTKLNRSRNGKLILEQIAKRWTERGFYSTSSAAMSALLEGVL